MMMINISMLEYTGMCAIVSQRRVLNTLVFQSWQFLILEFPPTSLHEQFFSSVCVGHGSSWGPFQKAGSVKSLNLIIMK